MIPYIHMTRIGFRRNLAYRWAHMINNIASAIFGFIYIALWQAVAPENPTMTSLMILTQSIAFVAIFLPAGLGIQNSVRSGAIALELTRPVPFFPLVIAREAGMVAYQGLYRSLPWPCSSPLPWATPAQPRRPTWHSSCFRWPWPPTSIFCSST